MNGDLPQLSIEAGGDRGLFVCVPQEFMADFGEYLRDAKENCLINPRGMAQHRPHGTDLVLFLHHSVEEVADRLTDYGFDVAP